MTTASHALLVWCHILLFVLSLAAKIVLFGLVFLAAAGIDLAFGPVLAALALPGLADAGAADRIYAAAMNRCLLTVAALYALLLASSLLGVAKP